MLDGYIIERIQRQREAVDAEREPLRISIPQPPPGTGKRGSTGDSSRGTDDVRPRDNDGPTERGVVDVDFSI